MSVDRGLLDSNILILRKWIPATDLPRLTSVSAVTLGELSAGVHLARNSADPEELARRLQVLQMVEHEFDPLPFDDAAARAFGRISAAVFAAGRTPRRRVADLMIAATAMANGLPLFTTNPDDFEGLDGLVQIYPVRRPTPID